MKKILVVDDQPNIRHLLSSILRTEERLVLEAQSGEEAVAMAKDQRPDLIIMDVVMPGGIDGLAATAALKADPTTSACPVLILTAKDERGTRERAGLVGASGYLTKPFNLDLLKRMVEELIA